MKTNSKKSRAGDWSPAQESEFRARLSVAEFKAAMAGTVGDGIQMDTSAAVDAMKETHRLIREAEAAGRPADVTIEIRRADPAAAVPQYGPWPAQPVTHAAPAREVPAVVKSVSRLENNRADSPYSRAGIPRHRLKPGWNLEESPRVSHQATPELSPASRARLARLSRQSAPALSPRKEIPMTLAQGEDKVIFLPTGEFKMLKKSNELREIKRRVEIWSRAVTLGTTTWHFSSRATAVTLTTGTTAGRDYSKVNDAGLRAAKLRRNPDEVKQAFRRIAPDKAEEMIRHLFRL